MYTVHSHFTVGELTVDEWLISELILIVGELTVCKMTSQQDDLLSEELVVGNSVSVNGSKCNVMYPVM